MTKICVKTVYGGLNAQQLGEKSESLMPSSLNTFNVVQVLKIGGKFTWIIA